jgi:hypothetical protein
VAVAHGELEQRRAARRVHRWHEDAGRLGGRWDGGGGGRRRGGVRPGAPVAHHLVEVPVEDGRPIRRGHHRRVQADVLLGHRALVALREKEKLGAER